MTAKKIWRSALFGGVAALCALAGPARAADPGIRRHLGMEDATDAAVFAALRRRKDSF